MRHKRWASECIDNTSDMNNNKLELEELSPIRWLNGSCSILLSGEDKIHLIHFSLMICLYCTIIYVRHRLSGCQFCAHDDRTEASRRNGDGCWHVYTHFWVLIKVKVRVESKLTCVDITHPPCNIEMASDFDIGTDEIFDAYAFVRATLTSSKQQADVGIIFEPMSSA